MNLIFIIGGLICAGVIIRIWLWIREEARWDAFAEEIRMEQIQSMAEYDEYLEKMYREKEDFEEIAREAGFETPDDWYVSILEKNRIAREEELESLEAEIQRLESITPEDILVAVELEEAQKAAMVEDLRAEVARLTQSLVEKERTIMEVKEISHQESEKKDNTSVVQNITYNIMDSSIVTDEFGASIGRKDD